MTAEARRHAGLPRACPPRATPRHSQQQPHSGSRATPRAPLILPQPPQPQQQRPTARPRLLGAHERCPDAREAARRRVATLCESTHITGRLGPGVPDLWVREPTLGGEQTVAALRDGARKRAADAVDPERAATALSWLNDFVQTTGRVPFVPLTHAGDLRSATYNAETFEMLAEFIRRAPSRQRGRAGKPLVAGTIDTYVSAIKTIVEMEAHHQLTLPSANPIAPRASKQQRAAQAPPGQRALKRGVRAQHLAILAPIVDRQTPQGLLEWCAAIIAHNLLLRGGEIGIVPNKRYDPSRDFSLGAVEFRAPCADSEWRPWLVVYTVPIKDGGVRVRSCPMAVQRRATGDLGSDPLCPYDAIVTAITLRSGKPPPATGRVDAQYRDLQLFVKLNGKAWDTDDSRRLASAYGKALGADPTEYGGKSFRIGGATDWREILGADAERTTKQRGRWHSDIAHIYQRALANTHLAASARVGSAAGADLEALCRGWTQPATY